MSFARCKSQTDRQPVCVHHCMNFAGQSASRATYRLASVSSDAGSVLMHAHDGRVDHLDGRIMSDGKRVHDPIPYSGPSPSDETVVAGGAWAIANRQIAPWCARTQDPKDAIEHAPIVYPWHAARFVRQQGLNGGPFKIAEFVAYDPRLQFRLEITSRAAPSTQRSMCHKCSEFTSAFSAADMAGLAAGTTRSRMTQGGRTEENDSGPRSVELLRTVLSCFGNSQHRATGSACATWDRLDNCSAGGTPIRLKLRSGMSLRAKPSNRRRVLCKPIKLTTSVPIAP